MSHENFTTGSHGKDSAKVLEKDLMAFLGDEALNLPNKRTFRQVDKMLGRLYRESVGSIYEEVNPLHESDHRTSQHAGNTKILKVKHLYLLTPELIIRYCSNRGGDCGAKALEAINTMLAKRHLPPVQSQ